MYGNSPRQTQRILFESTLHLYFNLFCLLVEGVFSVLPCLNFNLKFFIFSRAKNVYLLVINMSNVSDTSIIVSSIVIITNEHYLCTRL